MTSYDAQLCLELAVKLVTSGVRFDNATAVAEELYKWLESKEQKSDEIPF